MCTISDATTIAAIAGDFMSDPKFRAYYSGFVRKGMGWNDITQNLAWVGLQINQAKETLGFNWYNYDFPIFVEVVVKTIYERGTSIDWLERVKEILADQKERGLYCGE